MNKTLGNRKSDIKYDEIMDEIVKWSVTREDIEPEHFSKLIVWVVNEEYLYSCWWSGFILLNEIYFIVNLYN